jgi:PTH1 family peptidyl-tRNA hydrolase
MNQTEQALVVGLGNPGFRYARNRHNVGFMVLDELAGRLKLPFEAVSSSYGLAESDSVALLKPLTYMNRSGEALDAWTARTGRILTGLPDPGPEVPAADGAAEVPPSVVTGLRPLVVCDDLALPLGSVRLRARGSSGGQNGLGSIIGHLGGDEFPRLRLGIAPLDGPVAPEAWPEYVLADFSATEAEAAAALVSWAADAVICWLAEGLEAAVSRFNRRIRPES